MVCLTCQEGSVVFFARAFGQGVSPPHEGRGRVLRMRLTRRGLERRDRAAGPSDLGAEGKILYSLAKASLAKAGPESHHRWSPVRECAYFPSGIVNWVSLTARACRRYRRPGVAGPQTVGGLRSGGKPYRRKRSLFLPRL